MIHQVKPCINLKSSPFLVNPDAGFFSVATDVKHGFLSFGTLTVATCIPELHSPIELFFVTSKIVACSWLEPVSSFAFASGSKICGLCNNQGLYIIFQMDWKCVCCPPKKVHISVFAIIVTGKNIASGKKLQRLSWKHQWWST